MNLPNKLTVGRVLLIPLFLFLLLAPTALEKGSLFAPYLAFADAEDRPFIAGLFRLGALVVFVGAAITDWLDGEIARQRNLITPFGKLMDPLADKLLVASAFIALVELKVFPSWLIILILSREFLVTGLRALASDAGRVMAADNWGKHKTGWQMATVIGALTFLAAKDLLRSAGVWHDPFVRHWSADIIYTTILDLLLMVTVVLTIVSGWIYVKANADLIRDAG